MSRYQVGRDGDERDIRWPWVVVDTDPDSSAFELGPTFTDAEANIIAFALNAVAEGKSLMTSSQQQRLVIDANGASYYGALELYDGPMEGVAP